ncbi:hypothetical protein H4R18_002109 [Coemansia javaensis]|uniref:Dihydrofolate reductase n=1 Tax=Coemansia javaensis TaxID=2761396 RepID=A0A9W8LKE3_9FUNG|nr:hypothetical protein H4R18_002109 [Coemansia javaensis]
MAPRTLTLIAAAAAKNNGIGIGLRIPWRLPRELGYFHRVTTTVPEDEQARDGRPVVNACIVGRRTWEGIPPKHRPFPGRYTIVVTSSSGLLGSEASPVAVTQPSLAAALQHVDAVNADASAPVRIARVFVAGGGGIYEEAMRMPACRIQVLLTRVEFADADRCDAFFPPLDEAALSRQPHARLEEVVGFAVPAGLQTEAGIDYEFQLFESTR